MKRLIAVMLSAMLFASPVFAWEAAPKKEEPRKDESVSSVLWQDACDIDMLKQVRSDIQSAQEDKKVKTLKVTLLSPGGPVITCLEIARLVRLASSQGLTMEMHAVALCASGCTFILAAGTPGKRFITKDAFFLVHPPQSGGFGSEPECVKYVAEPKTVDDKVKNLLLNMLRDAYAKYTGHPLAEVETWLTCDKEIVANGATAVAMGIADKIE